MITNPKLIFFAAILLLLKSLNGYTYDLNNDGYDDIIFSNHYSGGYNVNSYIYWGDATASFSSKTELTTHGAYGNSVADLNGDGYMDIVFNNHYDGSSYNINSYIYWGDASASYKAKTELASHGTAGNSIGDLNGDGYMDIVISNTYDGSSYNINSYIYWGDATASYSTKSDLATHGAIANSLADLNYDGYVDIVVSNASNGNSQNINSFIYWGDATASYTTKTELATMSSYDNSVADINGDGYLDILFSNYADNNNLYTNSFIYWGDASGLFATKSEVPTNASISHAIADLNGDGCMDIIFSSFQENGMYNANSFIYWGDQTNPFATKTELATTGAQGIAVSDLDNDGYFDIIISNEYDGIAATYNTNSYIYWGDASASYTTRSELATQGAIGVSAGSMSAYGQNYTTPPQETIPEPASMILLALGGMGILCRKFKPMK